MKRAAAILFLLALPTILSAAAPTYPVLVATKHSGPLSIKSLALPFDPADPGRNYAPLGIVKGFAANLTAEEIEALKQSPEVLFVEPDQPRSAFGSVSGQALAPKSTAGPAIAQVRPYGIDLVHAPQAWVGGRGANVNVVVIDTGIDYKHPELAGIYAGGRNIIDDNDDPLDDEGHGTHVAGTIAASDNGVGVVGVAPLVHLWAAKVLDSQGNGRSSNIIKALTWVTQKKAELGGNWVVSLSLGSCSPSTLERQAFQAAVDAGVLVVAAAGNHNPDAADQCTQAVNNAYAVSYPAAYDGVVAVAAVNSNSAVADFSNFGPQVAISAPGVDVLSTFMEGHGSWSIVSSPTGNSVIAPPIQGSPARDFSGQYVFCNLGRPEDFTASVAGKIALIKRGDLKFHDKVLNAKKAGASAVVIFNKDDSAISWTLIGVVDANGKSNVPVCEDSASPSYNPNSCHQDPADLAFDWPLAVGIPLADGQALVDHPQGSITINYRTDDDYAIESGTSMATPHVTGVAAAVWSMAPGATATQVKQALLSTAHDLGDAGVDNKYGNGLVDAEAAGKALNPSAFNGATPPPTKPTGRVPGRRGH